MAAIPVPVPGDPTAQTWAAAVAGKLNGVSFYRGDKATDAAGNVTIAGTEWHPGVTTINGFQVTAFAPGGYVNATPFLSGTNIIVHCDMSATGAAGSWTPLLSGAVVIMIIAWSTAAQTLDVVDDEAESKPAPE